MASKRWRVRIPLAPLRGGLIEGAEHPTLGDEGSNPSPAANGALAHLGERNVRNVEVAGSSPACSTENTGLKGESHRKADNGT